MLTLTTWSCWFIHIKFTVFLFVTDQYFVGQCLQILPASCSSSNLYPPTSTGNSCLTQPTSVTFATWWCFLFPSSVYVYYLAFCSKKDLSLPHSSFLRSFHPSCLPSLGEFFQIHNHLMFQLLYLKHCREQVLGKLNTYITHGLTQRSCHLFLDSCLCKVVLLSLKALSSWFSYLLSSIFYD